MPIDWANVFSCNNAFISHINGKMRLPSVLVGTLFFFLSSAQAHDHGPSDATITSDLISIVLQRFANMDVTELPYVEENDRNGSHIKLKKRGRLFTLFLGEKHYEFSSKVTESDDILKLFSLIWLNEARKACSTCELPDPEILEEELENKLDMGWGSRAFVTTGDLLFEDFGGIAADVAYRKGFIFAVLKVLGEIAEQFLTGGWHFVCEVVTVVATFMTGPLNFLAKSITVPPFYENSRLLSSIRYMSAALVTKSILKRIDLGVKHFSINDEELMHFLEENEDQWPRHKILSLTANALKFIRLRGISDKVKDWNNKDQMRLNRVNRFIRGLERQQQRLEKKLESKRDLSDEEIALLRADLESVITLKKKAFLGKRFKRFFLLLKRKGIHSSGPFTQSNDLFKKSDFWYIPMEMEILNPHLNFTATDRRSMKAFDIADLSEETQWLSRGVQGERGQVALGKLIDSARNAFDGSLPRRQRQLHARRTGSFVNTVLPEKMKEMMSLKLKELKFRKEGFYESFGSWFTKFGTRRRFSTYFKLLDDYAYYLNFAAVSKGLKDPTLDMHMANHINGILTSYGRIAKAFSEVHDKESLRQFTQNFDKEIRHLKTLEPWREKSLKPTGIYNTFIGPAFNPLLNLISTKEAPQCLDLYQY
jgi:hypothetical protein